MGDGSNFISMTASEIGGQIVSGTLDTLNSATYNKSSNSGSSMSDTYNLSKSVLSAAYEGKGTILDNNS